MILIEASVLSGPQKDVRARKESGDYRKSSQETQPGLFRRVFGEWGKN